MQHIVIIGNGISGITTARLLRKESQNRITVISGESDHFFSRTALMYIYMGHMRYEQTKPYEDWFWAKNRIELMRAWVEKVDTNAKRLTFKDGKTLEYDTLIIATGSNPNRFGWPGQDAIGVQGLYSLQDLESMEAHTQRIERAVIVGGGLIGIEMAEMLLSRKIPVTFLVREREFWASVLPQQEAALISRHIRSHHVDLQLQTELQEIVSDVSGRVRAVKTKTGEEIPCQFVGLTTGVSPNIAFLKDSGIETNRGVLVNEYFETNSPDVYAIGDCAEYQQAPAGRKKIEQIWYTGRIHGETLAQTLNGRKTAYQPSIFFNSAKFFDIEYQTYGQVNNRLAEGEATFYWEDPSGQRSVRINYTEKDASVTGFLSLGMRLRHVTCEGWIKEKRSLAYVLEHLSEANFDPEFYRQYEPDIIQQYNQQHPQQPLKIKAKRGLFTRLFT